LEIVKSKTLNGRRTRSPNIPEYNVDIIGDVDLIAHLLQTTESLVTPLQRRLEQLGKILIAVALVLTALVVIIGVLQGHDVYTMILSGVSLAVAAIPEGLPAIVTVALALGVQRKIKRKAMRIEATQRLVIEIEMLKVLCNRQWHFA
jgi:P-type E1-E2 ATPase